MPMARATTTSRGYGASHQRMRAKYLPLVAAGRAVCARCGERIEPQDLWELDHSDDRSTYIGPSHQACNRRAGQAKSTAARMAKSAMTVRDW
ncbi:hypothetical protein [Micrococcus sp.]|uniref:hypothetical protein n=1 Tax=Micrococcus sp. TaxID=1271 RepID=UPI0026DB7B98|nr:hypothetical protein [Micrococcus sp.]MDO4240763.1 hypothetical protein [Micrococcus sp.]